MAGPITDPELLGKLNGGRPITDPDLLAKLEAGDVPGVERTPGGLYHYADAQGNEVYSKNPPPVKMGRFFQIPYEVPVSQKPKPASPTDVPFMENVDAGVGKFFTDTALGAQQRAADIGLGDRAALAQRVAQKRATDAPLADSVGGKIGNVAGAVAAYAPFAPAGFLGNAALGGLQGALQPTAAGESAINNTLLGAGLAGGGNLLTRALGHVAQPVTPKLDEHTAAAVQTLTDAGVPLTVAQRTGSPFLQRVAAGLSDNPITAGMAETADKEAKTGFNRAVLRTIGEDADAATSDVMGAAKRRLGQAFDDVATRNPVQFDTGLAGDLQRVLADADQALTADKSAVVQKQVANIVDAAGKGNGVINGEAWQRLYSALGKVTKNPEYGTFAHDIRESMESALERSAADPADVELIRQTRQQWQAMRQIEGAIAADGSGNISVLKLSNALGTKARNQAVYGQGPQDLVELAQAGRTVLKDLPNSGTPARAMGASVPSVMGAVGAEVLSGQPGRAAKILAMGLAPKAASKVVYATGGLGDYLSEGVQNPALRALLGIPASPAAQHLVEYGALPLMLQRARPPQISGQ